MLPNLKRASERKGYSLRELEEANGASGREACLPLDDKRS